MGIRGPGKSAAVQTPIDSACVIMPCTIGVRKWFADVETVKKMYVASSKSLTVQNEEEILVGFFENDLEYGNIVENSERVKVRQRALGPDVVTFTGGSWINLANDDIVKGTVVVTNTAETDEWIEGADYAVDYTSGRISRLILPGTGGTATGASTGEGSSISSFPAGITIENVVTVHYEYFLTKVKDIDYSINYDRGSLARKEGGSLLSGAKVYVDYKIRELVKDEVVALSVDQAHVWIINKIGEQYEGCTDENLRYGEAYLALYLISKMSAANLIYEKRNDDIEEAAKELKLISEDYRGMAFSYLNDYFQFPASRYGARIQKNPRLLPGI